MKPNVLVTVGVPVIAPVFAFKESPFGRVPPVTVYIIPLAPVALATEDEYGIPMSPFAGGGVLG